MQGDVKKILFFALFVFSRGQKFAVKFFDWPQKNAENAENTKKLFYENHK
jgi:hypothetical protein